MPESSATASSPVAAASARALSSAFSSKVVPVSSTPVSWPTTSTSGPRMCWTSSTLWALPVASSTRISAAAGGSLTISCCRAMISVDARLGQAEQRVELGAGVGRALGGALHLDEAAERGHHHVHVDLGPAVLDVGQVEHGHAVDDADGDGGAERRERVGRDRCPAMHEAGQRVVQREVAAADRRGAGAAVGLEHVAVDDHLPLAQQPHVAHGAQRAADEALDLLGAARRLAVLHLAADPLGRAARAASSTRR